MSDLKTLVNAATLKGYLMATGACAEMIGLAQDIVEGEIQSFRPAQIPGIEEYVPIADGRPKVVSAVPEKEEGLSISAEENIPVREESAEKAANIPECSRSVISAAVTKEESDATEDKESRDESLEDAPPPYKAKSRGEYCWNPEAKTTLLLMKGQGKPWSEISAATGKTVSQCQSMYQYERRRPTQKEGMRESGGERWNPKLVPGDLPTILEELKTGSFERVGHAHGVTGWAIVSFLKRNGIEHSQFKKKAGRAPVPEVRATDDEWPESEPPAGISATQEDTAEDHGFQDFPVRKDRKNAKLKHEDLPRVLKLLENSTLTEVATRIGESRNTVDNFLRRYGVDSRALVARNEELAAQGKASRTPNAPRMKFETVKTRDGWGHVKEIDIPVPLSVEQDPVTGVKVRKYPPGYASGAYPQRNTSVSGYRPMRGIHPLSPLDSGWAYRRHRQPSRVPKERPAEAREMRLERRSGLDGGDAQEAWGRHPARACSAQCCPGREAAMMAQYGGGMVTPYSAGVRYFLLSPGVTAQLKPQQAVGVCMS